MTTTPDPDPMSDAQWQEEEAETRAERGRGSNGWPRSKPGREKPRQPSPKAQWRGRVTLSLAVPAVCATAA